MNVSIVSYLYEHFHSPSKISGFEIVGTNLSDFPCFVVRFHLSALNVVEHILQQILSKKRECFTITAIFKNSQDRVQFSVVLVIVIVSRNQKPNISTFRRSNYARLFRWKFFVILKLSMRTTRFSIDFRCESTRLRTPGTI